jgi:hypothetical protein
MTIPSAFQINLFEKEHHKKSELLQKRYAYYFLNSASVYIK